MLYTQICDKFEIIDLEYLCYKKVIDKIVDLKNHFKGSQTTEREAVIPVLPDEKACNCL